MEQGHRLLSLEELEPGFQPPPQQDEPAAPRQSLLAQLPFKFRYEGQFPDALKLKKKLHVGPLQFSFAGIWDRKLKDFYHKVSVKDRILKGKFSYRADDPTIEYKKRFGFSRGGIPGSIVATAAWRLNNYSWRPALRLGFDLGEGNHVVDMGGLATRKKFYFSQTLGVEVCSLLRVQLPRNVGFEFGGQAPGLNQEGFHMDLDMKQLNLVLRL